MNYVITSGPALATVSSDVSYLTLLNTTNVPYMVCVITTDKTNRTRVLTLSQVLTDMNDVIQVLQFLKSATSQNGGVQITAINNDAISLATMLTACATSSNKDIQAAFAGVDPVLNVVAPAGTVGVYNTARYTRAMFAHLTSDALTNATSASMVISKV